MRNFKVKMREAGLFIACSVLLAHFSFAQIINKGTLKKIEGEYYVESQGKDYRVNPEVVTVKFKSGVTQSSISLDTLRANRLGYIDIVLPKGVDLVEYLNSLKNSNNFEVIEYNTYGEFCSTFVPNDPMLPNQWSLQAVNIFDAWAITTGSPSVKLAVIDAPFV